MEIHPESLGYGPERGLQIAGWSGLVEDRCNPAENSFFRSFEPPAPGAKEERNRVSPERVFASHHTWFGKALAVFHGHGRLLFCYGTLGRFGINHKIILEPCGRRREKKAKRLFWRSAARALAEIGWYWR